MAQAYPVQYDVDYPDRMLNRLTSFFRIFTAIPIVIVLVAIGGVTVVTAGSDTTTVAASGSALLVLPPLLMLLFRGKYPRWWYDFNVELLRFQNRVGVYVALMDDRYPSTDQQQGVRLTVPQPAGLNRWLPLVKWLLALPHYFVLAFLYVGAIFAIVIAWVSILFSGRFPRPLFDYLVGVGRWTNRVVAYAAILVTDEYPPFRLSP
jgi:Domain of unknown function (DUF4389)